MAPSRTTKKSNNASTYDDATRQETRISRKQEESEEMRGTEDEYTSNVDHDDQEEELDETQSKSAEELLSTMVAGARKRHVAKKKKVIESYSTTFKTIETSIDTLFDEHEEKSSEAEEVQLKRLEELLKHKANIELAMEAKLMALRGSYDAHSHDLENVLNSRVRELK